MATVPFIQEGALPYNTQDGLVYSWALTAGDDGQPVYVPGNADRSVHVVGDLAGGTVVLEGSNEPTTSASNYVTLIDGDGNPLSFSAPDFKDVRPVARQCRARRIGGGGGVVTVYLFVKR